MPQLDSFLHAHPGIVDIIEVEPQTLWLAPHAPNAAPTVSPGLLAYLRSLPYRKLIHGVGGPVGNSQPIDPMELSLLNEFIRELDSPWLSEHLSYNVAVGDTGPFFAGFFLPPRQSPDGVEMAVRRIRDYADRLGVPVLVETGVSYLQPRRDEMLDGDFVASVASAADCGILLDLHNIWTNERNGRQRVSDFLRSLPLERVRELHLAGGQEHRGYWLDAHTGEIPPELLAIASDLVPRLPALEAIIFELLPEHVARLGDEALCAQVAGLRDLWRHRDLSTTVQRSNQLPASVRLPTGPAPLIWENTLAVLAIGGDADGPLAEDLKADPGLAVLRELIEESRAGAVVTNLGLSIRLLLMHLGEAKVRRLLHDGWATWPPQRFASKEASSFADFIASRDLNLPHLPEILAYERAQLAPQTSSARSSICFRADPDTVIDAIKQGRMPPPVEDHEYVVEFGKFPLSS